MLASTLRTLSVQTRNWLSASQNIAKWFQTDVMDLFAKEIISLKEKWVSKKGSEGERKRDRRRDWVEIWCFTFNFSASPCIACLAILELDWIFSFASSHSRFQQIFFIFGFIPFSLFDLKITQFSSKLFDFPHLLPNERSTGKDDWLIRWGILIALSQWSDGLPRRKYPRKGYRRQIELKEKLSN